MISIATASFGTIQPIPEITSLAKQMNIFFYGCCAICWHYGVEFKRKFSRRRTLSSHKIYGPRGVGLLYLKTGILMLFLSIILNAFVCFFSFYITCRKNYCFLCSVKIILNFFNLQSLLIFTFDSKMIAFFPIWFTEEGLPNDGAVYHFF